MFKIKEKASPKALALEYFDFYYGSTFGAEWSPIRLAMLTGTSKPTALINNFAINSNDTMRHLESQTALDLFKFSFQFYKKTLDEHKTGPTSGERLVRVPEMLRVFCFDNGDTTRFRSPRYDSSNGGLLGNFSRYHSNFEGLGHDEIDL